MFFRPNARHSQIAYVTSDLERALEVWREDFNVPSFFVFANDAPGLESSQPYRLKIALANVGGVEIELIEPLNGSAPLFSDALAKDEPFCMRFHHVAMRISGPLASFESHLASLNADSHPVIWQGGVGDHMRFAYTDERRTLGHYIEHVWFDDEFYKQMAAAIPVYPGA